MAAILLVEDDVWMADCYRQWLQADHTVRHARDAQDALDMIDDEPPQLIVLDLLLPHASGVQLLHTLQSHADLARIPVVLCSSSLPAGLPALAAYGVRAALDKTTLAPAAFRSTINEALTYAAL